MKRSSMNVKLLTKADLAGCIKPFWQYGKWDGIRWQTLIDIVFEVDGIRYEIPSGFVCDMGSIPRAFRPTINRMGNSLVGFIIHDWLYCPTMPLTRKQADMVLYEIGRAHGESWYTANKIYYGVRAGGWIGKMKPNEFHPVDTHVLYSIILSNKVS